MPSFPRTADGKPAPPIFRLDVRDEAQVNRRDAAD
jgi:hypothetical protein